MSSSASSCIVDLYEKYRQVTDPNAASRHCCMRTAADEDFAPQSNQGKRSVVIMDN